MYLVKTPSALKLAYPDLLWKVKSSAKVIYLTFDDGPDPKVTPKVLDILAKFSAKATFFCIGKQVVSNPNLFTRVLEEQHAVGNHTWQHENGSRTRNWSYFKSILATEQVLASKLFRPPYGRISRSQISGLRNKYKIVMWDVLSGDFDARCTPEKCVSNVLKNTGNGSIVVFHDTVKSASKMLYALPIVIEHFSREGYTFEALPESV